MSRTWHDIIAPLLPRHAQLAGADTLTALAAKLAAAQATPPGTPAEIAERLFQIIIQLEREIASAFRRQADHDHMLSGTHTDSAKRNALFELVLSSVSHDQAEDLNAVDRWLDDGAIRDRDLVAQHTLSQQMEFACLASQKLIDHAQTESTPERTLSLLTQSTIAIITNVRIHWAARVSAVRLAGALARNFSHGRARTRQLLLDTLGQETEVTWVRAACLEVTTALRSRDGLPIRPLLESIMIPSAANDIFLRARTLRVAAMFGETSLALEAIETRDPSPHVLATAVRILAGAIDVYREHILLLLKDSTVERVVRAHAAISVVPTRSTGETAWASVVEAALHRTQEPWVVKNTLSALIRHHADLQPVSHCRELWAPWLVHWAAYKKDPDLSESAAWLRLYLEVAEIPDLLAAFNAITQWSRGAPEGTSHKFTEGPVATLDESHLIRVLALGAAHHFDLSAQRIENGFELMSSAPAQPTFWRFMHEAMTPAPDKRQAYSHVVDRVPSGDWVGLSRHLAEVTPTRVPGTRTAHPNHLHWGIHVPLPSALLAAAQRGSVTFSTPGQSWSIEREQSALRATLLTQRHYRRYDALRRRFLADPTREASLELSECVRTLGLKISQLGAFAPIWNVISSDHLLSDLIRTDTNTPSQLGAAALVALAGFTLYQNRVKADVARDRERVPLVIGGWGSRGKSGTERLKAALFHGFGYRVFSKTTGCEAMVISSIPGDEPTEIFLYRPYDKASISEQRRVLKAAAEIGAQVLLWECMGLNPNYVRILQRDWMRDDLSTITNTYPDHEDIQGPSGRDVAETIAEFLPENKVAITTEQHMIPILRARALERGTQLVEVADYDSALIAPDLLARLPYKEHPRNVALVARLAEELEMDFDVAIKAMADHVVPDLGVLRQYGPAPYRERTLSFINGMSANERAGFVSNWVRMGLDTWNETEGLREATAIVVNNRADRPARSVAFSRIITEEAPADAYFVIGTAVDNFDRTARKAMREIVVPELRALGKSSRARLAAALAGRLRRIPLTSEVALAHIDRVCGPETPQSEQTQRWLREVTWLQTLTTTTDWDIDEALTTFERIWNARLVPLSDPALSGDQILQIIAERFARESNVTILGCQNIKGTGLDFVYRWLSIELVKGCLATLAHGDIARATEALSTLTAHDDFGVIDAQMMATELDRLARSGRLRLFGLQEQADYLRKRSQWMLEQREAALVAGPQTSMRRSIIATIEAAVDFADSMARHFQATQLWDDLMHRRVGHKRAALVAKKLVERGKGGWLSRPK